MILSIEKLCKSYGGNKALDDFTMELSPGIYGLLGPNGAGKSTLMSIIAGNLAADSGTILCDGRDTVKMGREFRAMLGYMPQHQGSYETFTASRFLFYIAALKGLTAHQANMQIPEVLSRVNLFACANQRIGTFSGGMKQRILLAQAVLGEPELLILDEPTAGLDPKERIRIRNLISEIAFEKTVIIATHVVSDVEFIAKELVFLKKGHMISRGKPYELTAGLSGKVFEVETEPEQLESLSNSYRVSNITRDEKKIYVRVVSDDPPEGFLYTPVKPTVEDVYLYTFDTRQEEPA